MLKRTHDLSTGLGRLAQLADDLLSIEGTFDLTVWQDSLCGTAACTVGWCTTFDWARKQDFILGTTGQPVYKVNSGWDAVESFFELSREEAYYLFSAYDPSIHEEPHRASCKETQSAHIKDFLKQKGYYA